MRIEELDYELPPRLIATQPAQPRDSARLLVVYRDDERLEHCHVADLADMGLFTAGDLMVVNKSRVLPAQFQATRVKTGGKIGGLFLRSDPDHQWQVLLESRGRLQLGDMLQIDPGTTLCLMESSGNGRWKARLDGDPTILERQGQMPLPPYIRRERHHRGELVSKEEDAQHYNTVYANVPGSVAAPTAGLHFTEDLLDRLAQTGLSQAQVVLHIGTGTFAPIRSNRLDQHKMHPEAIEIPAPTITAIRCARSITAVGTTTVRALESLPEPLPKSHTGQTELFIRPGFEFRFTDHLLTNFHLPKSTLLALVASLPNVGIERLLSWYRVAIDHGYRFYSYGDTMLIV